MPGLVHNGQHEDAHILTVEIRWPNTSQDQNASSLEASSREASSREASSLEASGLEVSSLQGSPWFRSDQYLEIEMW